MATSNSTFFSGPMFEILAGPEARSLLAHASVLTKSDKLKALIDGRWKDSNERKIVLKDWDVGTVTRLLEWLYAEDFKWLPPDIPLGTEVPKMYESSNSNSKNPTNKTQSFSSVEPLTPIMDQQFRGLESKQLHLYPDKFAFILVLAGVWAEPTNPEPNCDFSYGSNWGSHYVNQNRFAETKELLPLSEKLQYQGHALATCSIGDTLLL